MNGQGLSVKVEEARARRLLGPGLLRRLLGGLTLGRLAAPSCLRCEIVWLPAHHVEFSIEGDEKTLHLLHGGGETGLLGSEVPELVAVSEAFPPAETSDEAVAAARERLVAGGRGGGRRMAALGPGRVCGLVHRPYWVYYYRRGHGGIDFHMLDAHTGQRVGPRLKTVFLGCLARSRDGAS